jgi:hypothetical protein
LVDLINEHFWQPIKVAMLMIFGCSLISEWKEAVFGIWLRRFIRLRLLPQGDWLVAVML